MFDLRVRSVKSVLIGIFQLEILIQQQEFQKVVYVMFQTRSDHLLVYEREGIKSTYTCVYAHTCAL